MDKQFPTYFSIYIDFVTGLLVSMTREINEEQIIQGIAIDDALTEVGSGSNPASLFP